jgi:transcriptional regulator with GAF, ATPase, and Fis domain
MSDNSIDSIRDIPRDQFRTLYEISKTLNSAVYQDSLVADALDLVIKFLKADRGLFCKYDQEASDFKLVTARNVDQDNIQDLNSFSSGILKQVLEKKQASLYHDAQGDPDISQFRSIQIHNIKSVLGVPVFYQNNVWGVILVDSQENRQEFTEQNLTFLEFFSSLISLVLDKVIRMENLRDENVMLRQQLESASPLPDIIGNSRRMNQLAVVIRKVAQTDASVLILGESGTGKELIARAIHSLSPRKNKPFIAQFCGSIPDTLLESELFGYKKGAFTGAYADKKGLFEVAHDGTFLLDEIADISMALQAKLLRVLENRQIIRLGDTSVREVDVRIIAATNKDLSTLVKEKKFRADLFYRLNVFPVQVPALRERREDIAVLVKHFIKKNSVKNISIDKDTIKILENYNWPGNVRQLENVIKRALILCDDEKILPQHVALEEEDEHNDFNGQLKDYEQLILRKRLEEYNGNRTLTAKSLGVSVRWVQLKLKEMEK